MTITSSLNAGVAGLNANANRLSTISDNIANSSTFGYKKATADFYSVVVQGDLSTSYSAGGVRSTSYRLIDEHGPLIGTTNSTDFAIDGRGFMAVTTIDAVNRGADLPISLTTTGSFKPDAEGVLRTSTGKVLMGWVANPDGSLGNYPRDTMSALQPVRLDTNQYISNPTTELSLSANLPATSTAAGATGASWEMTVQYAGNLGTSENLHFTFTPLVPATGRSNEWTMTIRDSASDNDVIAEYTVLFDSSQASGGTLSSITTLSADSANPDYNATTGMIELAVGGGTINMNVGAVGVTGGMTQLSQDFAPIGKAINGTPVARLVSVNIDDNGYLTANYDQGFSKVIYQIPVVDVPNPNGLISHSDQTYEISSESGAFYLWNSGDGPTGKMVGYSREQSTTDVTQELTNLITTQRAYSSNVKVIQTVDEMLQETANLKR